MGRKLCLDTQSGAFAGHIVPKDNMEKQWHLLSESSEFGLLSAEQKEVLKRLLLGRFGRGLYC